MSLTDPQRIICAALVDKALSEADPFINSSRIDSLRETRAALDKPDSTLPPNGPKQHIVTIIQGNGDVLTVPFNPVNFWEVDEYVSAALSGLRSTLNLRRDLVLPLTIHYIEVE